MSASPSPGKAAQPHPEHPHDEHEHNEHGHDEHEHNEHGHDEHGHHGHGHGGHSHGVSADADRRYLTAALTILLGFMAVEVVVGIMARSLALLSDAGHMLSDAGSLVLALVAMRLAARPATGRMTFGWKRSEILSAQVNGLTLLLMAVWFAYEAVRRLIDPPEVAGGLVLATALVGIVVNIAAVWLVSRANRSSLNVEGAYQHILNDLWAFIATAISGLVVLLTGFARADAVAALVVAYLMAKAGIMLVRESGRIFLEAAPVELDPDQIGEQLAGHPGLVEVHDLHVWTITSGSPALSAHVLVAPQVDCHQLGTSLRELLRKRHNITHATLQVDHVEPGAAGDDTQEHCEDSHGTTYQPAAGTTSLDGGKPTSRLPQGSGSLPDANGHCAETNV